jgi:nitronate monooxygenase
MTPGARLWSRIGLRVPILQAPMAGVATPALAAAVSAAGGLGALGSATLPLPALAAEVAAFQRSGAGPLNLNFFCHAEPARDAAAERAALARLAPAFAAAGLPLPEGFPDPAYPAFGPAERDFLLQARPAVASFHFGLPDAATVARLRAAGIVVIATATSVAEARAVAAAGADAVIAQGWEAGGHRGALAPEPPDSGIGLMALLPQVVDAVALPVIAAGGIADGRGIAAALALGAAGVQIGTAFLRCPEAATPAGHRAALAAAQDSDTHLTAAYSGRPARARRSAFGAALQHGCGAPYPLPRPLTQALGRADPDAAFWLYGQAAALARDAPAAAVMAGLIDGTRAALAALGREERAWISA